jgi:hypothetical protein
MNRAVARCTRRDTAGALRFSVPLTALIAVLVAVLPAAAEARPRPSGGTPFTANKTFGLGLVVVEPIGLSAKYYLSESTALDFAFGEYDRFRDDDDLGVHADFLWHPFTIATTDPFLLPLYFGIGARVLDDEDGPDGDDDVNVGVRGPLGVALDFNRVPLDVFFELALIIELVDDEDDDNVDLDAALGIRYYF